jgi:hypothetical protein
MMEQELEQHGCDDLEWLMSKTIFPLLLNLYSFTYVGVWKFVKQLGKNFDRVSYVKNLPFL